MSAAAGSGLADRSGSLIAGRVVRAPPHQGGRSMAETTEAFVGIDVAKLRNAVAVADAGRDGEVRFHGEVDASPESMRRLAAKLAGKYERLHFCVTVVCGAPCGLADHYEDQGPRRYGQALDPMRTHRTTT